LDLLLDYLRRDDLDGDCEFPLPPSEPEESAPPLEDSSFFLRLLCFFDFFIDLDFDDDSFLLPLSLLLIFN
jgi:hypothetical protein